MRKIFLLPVFLLGILALSAQSAILITDPVVDQVVRGNYNPSTYLATNVLNHPDTIIPGIFNRISADSLRATLERLENGAVAADHELCSAIGNVSELKIWQSLLNYGSKGLISNFLRILY